MANADSLAPVLHLYIPNHHNYVLRECHRVFPFGAGVRWYALWFVQYEITSYSDCGVLRKFSRYMMMVRHDLI